MTQIPDNNRFLLKKQTIFKKKTFLLCACLFVSQLPSLNPLYAQGVAAGVDISNTAVVSYQIGGVTQTPLNSPPAVFKVDRKIDLTLTGNTNANVTAGDLQAEVTYTLVNEGNDIQEFSLIPDTTLVSDNFDISNCNTVVTSITGTPLTSVPATGNIKLKADQQASISVKCDVPLDNAGSPILNGHNSLLALHATAEKNYDNSQVIESTGADTAMGIETVFADGAGLDDANRDASFTARRSYIVGTSLQAPIATSDTQINTGLPSPTNITLLALVTANDNDADGTVDASSIDLNPSLIGIQTTLSNDDGIWSTDNLGNVTFTPKVSLTTSPAPITYTVNDNHGNTSNQAHLTVIYGHLPVAVNDTSIDHIIGTSVTIDPLLNDTDSDGQEALEPSSVVLISTAVSTDGKTLTVTGEGVWTVNPTTGEITFTPETDFSGDPTPVSYTVNNTSGNTSNVAVISIDYKQITNPPAELNINKTIVSTVDPQGANKAISGAVVTYKITVATTGIGIITNTIITDPTPVDMTYKVGSIKLNNNNLTDSDDSDNADFGISHSNTATINLGDITAGSQYEILLSYTIN